MGKFFNGFKNRLKLSENDYHNFAYLLVNRLEEEIDVELKFEIDSIGDDFSSLRVFANQNKKILGSIDITVTVNMVITVEDELIKGYADIMLYSRPRRLQIYNCKGDYISYTCNEKEGFIWRKIGWAIDEYGDYDNFLESDS
ncbi:hypothetical protein H0A36_21910 [Endozoicomonas sp. SM1973]|uniref:Uncharacterized protein n=1 Tax=Spartinivicinus marinus TaxID=2994442 RepID=A0A853IGT5_9GAMM|nr:hypothetical protein [Spartinivicinus marinus]MCX4025861.1 hypothetical protein [Spartinivicinus marinus]NYZ68677.1 hypothetical protein [Spartinivicinus marinus]